MLRIMLAIWAFVLLTPAAAWATRFVTTDRLTLPIRRFLVRKYGTEFWLTYLVHCRYCTATWVTAPAAVGWAFIPGAPAYLAPAVWLAMAYLVPVMLKVSED
jgi:hypothetical protein